MFRLVLLTFREAIPPHCEPLRFFLGLSQAEEHAINILTDRPVQLHSGWQLLISFILNCNRHLNLSLQVGIKTGPAVT